MVNDGNFVNITQINLLKLSGQFEAVNEDGSLVSAITLNTISTFNNYLKYYPSEIGVFSFSVSIYLKLSSDFYFPIKNIKIEFNNLCYVNCKTCSNSQCKECQDFYIMFNNYCTSIFNPPEGYYNDLFESFDPCAVENCKECPISGITCIKVY